MNVTSGEVTQVPHPHTPSPPYTQHPPLAHPHFHVDETRTQQLKAEAAAKKKAEKEAAKASAAAAAPPASAAASARSKAKAGAADEEELDPTQYFANRSRCACYKNPMWMPIFCLELFTSEDFGRHMAADTTQSCAGILYGTAL